MVEILIKMEGLGYMYDITLNKELTKEKKDNISENLEKIKEAKTGEDVQKLLDVLKGLQKQWYDLKPHGWIPKFQEKKDKKGAKQIVDATTHIVELINELEKNIQDETSNVNLPTRYIGGGHGSLGHYGISIEPL